MEISDCGRDEKMERGGIVIAAPFDRWFQTLAPHGRTVVAAVLLAGVVTTGVGCSREGAAKPCGDIGSSKEDMATLRVELDEQKKAVEKYRAALVDLREWLDIEDPYPEESTHIIDACGGSWEVLARQRRCVRKLEWRVESLRRFGAIRMDAKFGAYAVPGSNPPVQDLQSWLEASQQVPTDALAVLQDTLSSRAVYERRLLENAEKGDREALLRISSIPDKQDAIRYATAKARYLNQKKILEAGQRWYDEGMLAIRER